MKKKMVCFLAAVMTVASLAACGGSSKPAETPAAASSEAASESEAAASSEETAAASEAEAADSDYIISNGKLVVGITDFAPMDYQDESGEWIGFDADLAKMFAESLGVEAELVEINWDNKIMELDGKTIDCVWNGMTLTADVQAAMECSNAYCNNAQVVVVPAEMADQITDVESLADLNIAAESGSAGEEVLLDLELNVTPFNAQADALMEVAAGTSDACVIDALMAAAMIGEGTSYENLTYTISLNSEEYGVGFRKGSDLAEKLNAFFAEKYADGTLQEVAEKYGVQAALIEQ